MVGRHRHGIRDEDNFGSDLLGSLEEHSDVPVQPSVCQHDDGVTPFDAQQFVGTIKSRMGQGTRFFAEAAKEECPISGQNAEGPIPLHQTEGARAITRLASPNSDSGIRSAMAVRSPPWRSIVARSSESGSSTASRLVRSRSSIGTSAVWLAANRLRSLKPSNPSDREVRITVASLVPTAWAISRADIAAARGPAASRNSATDRSIGLRRSADLVAKLKM